MYKTMCLGQYRCCRFIAGGLEADRSATSAVVVVMSLCQNRRY